jgi:hypothetical protein
VASTRRTGYKLVLPPGWGRLPLRRGTDEAVRGILDEVVRRLPRDLPRDKVTPYRKELERRLARLVADARRNGGLDMYLPVDLMHGTPVAASFVVSEGSLGAGSDADPGMIISYLAAQSEHTTAVTADGAVGARIERTAGAEPAKDVTFASRRVDYMISVPGERDRWLVIAFSTLGGGNPDDEYAKLLVGLFDAIMSTFRWTS